MVSYNYVCVCVRLVLHIVMFEPVLVYALCISCFSVRLITVAVSMYVMYVMFVIQLFEPQGRRFRKVHYCIISFLVLSFFLSIRSSFFLSSSFRWAIEYRQFFIHVSVWLISIFTYSFINYWFTYSSIITRLILYASLIYWSLFIVGIVMITRSSKNWQN